MSTLKGILVGFAAIGMLTLTTSNASAFHHGRGVVRLNYGYGGGGYYNSYRVPGYTPYYNYYRSPAFFGGGYNYGSPYGGNFGLYNMGLYNRGMYFGPGYGMGYGGFNMGFGFYR